MSEALISSQKTRERQRRCGSVDCSKRGTSGLAGSDSPRKGKSGESSAFENNSTAWS